MKKTITALSIFFLTQHITAQVRVAVKGGWNFSNAKAVYSGVKQKSEFAYGYGAGITAKIPFDGVLHFSPSVMLNKRGFVIKPSTGTTKSEQYTLTYIDIIPSLSVDFPYKTNSLVIHFGPNFSFTNWGKIKTTDNNNNTSSQKIKFGFERYGWIDLGLNAGVAYHMKKVFVELGYMHGLANINNNEEVDMRNLANRMLSLNVGYYIR
jgi:hypothetical protein